jgi:hypothetical protein
VDLINKKPKKNFLKDCACPGLSWGMEYTG